MVPYVNGFQGGGWCSNSREGEGDGGCAEIDVELCGSAENVLIGYVESNVVAEDQIGHDILDWKSCDSIR